MVLPIKLFTFKLNMSIVGKFSLSISDTHSRNVLYLLQAIGTVQWILCHLA